MLTPEGTVSRSEGSAGTSYTYNYFKTDHLGSTRARAMLNAANGTLQASQQTDYYSQYENITNDFVLHVPHAGFKWSSSSRQ